MRLELSLKLLNYSILGCEVLLQLEESCRVHVELGVEIEALSEDLAVVDRCVKAARAWSSWRGGDGGVLIGNLGGSDGLGVEGEGVEVEVAWIDGILSGLERSRS